MDNKVKSLKMEELKQKVLELRGLYLENSDKFTLEELSAVIHDLNKQVVLLGQKG